MKQRYLSILLAAVCLFALLGRIPSERAVSAQPYVLEGALENPVVFLELDGCEGYFSSEKREQTLDGFNSREEDAGSLWGYFDLISEGKLGIESQEALSVSLDDLRESGICPFDQELTGDYFRTQSSENPKGFPSALKSERERMLVGWVLKALEKQGWNGGSDLNGDGVLDMLTIYISVEGVVSSSDILWPHMTSYTGELGKVGSLSVRNYVIVSDGVTEEHTMPTSVVCHETIHLLNTLGPNGAEFGVTDLYPYSDAEACPVGVWDIMGNTTPELQNLNAVYREKFGWIQISTLEKSGPVTLEVGQAVRFGERDGEYFVVENRGTRGVLDVKLLDNPLLGQSALVIYRVRSGKAGNISEPYEIVFFENTAEEAITGNPNVGKTPQAFFALFYPDNYSDFAGFVYGDDEGTDSGMLLFDICRVNEGTSLTFRLNLNERAVPANGTLLCDGQPVESAEVLLNGEQAATTDKSGAFELSAVRRGDRVSFRKRGYRFDGEIMILFDEGASKLNLDLTGIEAVRLPERQYTVTVRDSNGDTVADAAFTLNGEPFQNEYADGTLTFSGYEGDVLGIFSATHSFADNGQLVLTEQTELVVTAEAYLEITLSFTESGKSISQDVEIFCGGERIAVAKGGTVKLTSLVRGQILSFASNSYEFEELTLEKSGEYTLEGALKSSIIRLPSFLLYLMAAILVVAIVIALTRDVRKPRKKV